MGRARPLIAFYAPAALWAGLFLMARSEALPPDRLARWLMPLTPLAARVAMLLTLLALALCGRELVRLLRPLPLRHAGALVAILAASTAIRLLWVPATERVYYDDHSYRQLALSIAATGRAEIASEGSIEGGRLRCVSGSYAHWSVGWPTLLAAAGITPGDVGRAASVNLALSLITVALVAAIGHIWFPGTAAGLWGAAVMAALPAGLVWSRSGSTETAASCAAALAFLAAVVYARAPSGRAALLLACALAVAAQTRNEVAGMVIPVAALVWPAGRRRPELTAAWGLLVTLLLPQAAHLGYVSQGYEPAEAAGAGFGGAFVLRNLASVGGYVGNEPLIAGALILATLGLTPLRRSRLAVPVILWGLCLALPPLAHFGGSYGFPGGERFAVVWLPALCLAAGAGLHSLLLSQAPQARLLVGGALAAALFAASAALTGPHCSRMDALSSVPRQDVAFLRKALDLAAPEGVIVTADPPVVLAEGGNGVSYRRAAESHESLRRLLDGPRPVYMLTCPSSQPSHWPGGEAALARLEAAATRAVVVEDDAPEGLRVLSRLEPRPRPGRGSPE